MALVAEQGAASAELVDLRLLPLVAAGLADESYPPQVRAVAGRVRSAEALVIGAPVHRSAIAGISRNWLELLREGLNGKAVVPVVAAGSVRAHLAAEAMRGDLFLNFSARPTRAVVVTPDMSADELDRRLTEAIGEAAFTEALAGR